MKAQIILCASTVAELKAGLAELNTEVSARSQGRTSTQVERYSVAYLLATMALERLAFPLTLTHRDKPDFLLAMSSNDVGIEHTEAVPENFAREQFFREKGLGPDVYFIPHIEPGEPRKTAAELRREIQENAVCKGWVGDLPEHEWSVAMAHYVKKKLYKATADQIEQYSANWLLVYDNWPLPAIDYAKAASYLAPLLASMEAFSVFDAVFIHDDSRIFEFRQGTIIHQVNYSAFSSIG